MFLENKYFDYVIMTSLVGLLILEFHLYYDHAHELKNINPVGEFDTCLCKYNAKLKNTIRFNTFSKLNKRFQEMSIILPAIRSGS